MNLKTRIERLEETVSSKDIFFPALVYFSDSQTLDQAKEEYRQKHGFDLPRNGVIINFVEVDARVHREGGQNAIQDD